LCTGSNAAVGEPVEKAVSSNPYYDTVAVAKRAGRRAVRTAEGISRRGLHLLNLPAGTDIRRVREQLARMDRRLLEISKDIDDLEAAARESREGAETTARELRELRDGAETAARELRDEADADPAKRGG
jgi:hypothetical protein